MTNWRYVALLHNLQLEAAVGNEYIAVVPPSDERLSREQTQSGFRKFVSRFQDQFGRKVRPSVLIVREDVKQDLDLLVGFRNALAVTAVAQAWMKFLSHGAQLQYFKFSDYFSLYPHVLSNDGQDIVVNSPALFGLDEVQDFHGQTTPGIPTASSTKQFYDVYLLEALLGRWKNRFITRSNAWIETALFRSLQMAYRASAMPFQNNATFEDYGTQLSLWVSAHEILTRPEQAQVSLSEVLSVLASARFLRPSLRAKRYSAKLGKNRIRMTLVQKLYCEMYQSRNHFLHGNPVTPKDVFPSSRRDRYPLTCFAPVIYRCALYSFLGLWNQDVYTHAMTAECIRRAMYEDAYEDALMAATKQAKRRRGATSRRKT